MAKHIHKFGAWIKKLERVDNEEGDVQIEATIQFRALSDKDLEMAKTLGLNQPIILVITD